MDYQDLLVDTRDGVATITLNQPQRLNALTALTAYELITSLRAAEADDAVRAIVLTGAGRGFCAGVDLASPIPAAEYERLLGERELKEFPGFFSLVSATIGKSRKPTICAVNGVAAGAGLALALACDIRYASSTARFTTIFKKRAMVAHAGMGYYLPRAVGTARALELLWTSRSITAEKAREIGLVSEVTPPEELMPVVLGLAREIAAGPTVSIELDKRIIYGAMATDDLRRVMQHEMWASAVARETEDSAEGIRSFLERRDPVFKGR